ncbi:MAG TPA: hypothetical protein VHE81_13325 [Lacipirellulaceae bacterium]|nr:hypothetical protein [Lacipirellulaceae bacterium]
MTEAEISLWHRLRYSRLQDVLRGRLDMSRDWRRIIAAADLPPELSDAVRQVVGRTRLWRREKVDVAAELVAHFHDGLAAGRSSHELLKSFGDPVAAAQLIRRAKKRGRSVIWHTWHYGWMAILGLVLLYIATGLWMATGRPSVKTDYLAVINQKAASVPQDQRAWPLYRDAFLAMGGGKTEANSKLNQIASHKPGEPDWADTKTFLTTHADAIAQLREAAQRPTLGFVAAMSIANFSPKDRELFGDKVTPEQIEAAKHETVQDHWLISTLLPHMQWLRTGAWLLAADALRASSSGDGKTAFDDVVALLELSRQSQETPFMVCALVAEAIQKQARTVIQETLTQHPDLWDIGQIRNIAHQLVASPIVWRLGFEGERASFYDSVQRIYTDNGNGDGRLALHVSRDENLFQLLSSVASGSPPEASAFSYGAVAMLTLPAANMVVASRKDMTELYDKITDQALSQLATPYWKRANDESLNKEVHSYEDGPISRYRYFLVSMLTPSYDTLLSRTVVSDAERDGIYIGLTLELYHREHHQWPKSLDELSPRWLPAVPVDPITGKSLHYKVVNDRPIVYSVGTDGDDDGGRIPRDDAGKTDVSLATPACSPPTDGDWVLWTTFKNK